MPTVSVIVPNYNHSRFLQRRIDSILRQTFQDFELILLDDCSTDDSRSVLSQYATDARVRIEFNEANSGSTFKQWNKGVRLASGKYVWFAESDDYADERLLERLVGVLDSEPTITLAYCQSRLVSDDDRLNGLADYYLDFLDSRRWKSDFCANGREECQNYFVFVNTVPNASAVVFRRDVYERVGGADESLRLCGDWKLWGAMALQGKIAYLSEPLNYFREHDSSVRSKFHKSALEVAESLQVIRWILDQVTPTDVVLESVCQGRARSWVPAVMGVRVPLTLKMSILKNILAIDPHPIRRAVRPAIQDARRKISQLPHVMKSPKTRAATAGKLSKDSGLRERLVPSKSLGRRIANLVRNPWISIERLRLRRANKELRRSAERPTLAPRPISGPAPQAHLWSGVANRRVICVSHVLPYPSRAGNEYRIHRMLTWLSGRGFDVFLVVCPPPGDSITTHQLTSAASVYPNLIVCQRDGTVLYRLAEDEMAIKRLAGVKPRDFGALLGEQNRPQITQEVLSITRTFCPDFLVEVLQHLDAALKPQVVWVNYVWMTRALLVLKAPVLKVVDTHDVFSTKRDKVTQFGVKDRYTLTPEEEKQLLNRADLVVSIQSAESEELRRLAPEKQVVTAGVDFDSIDLTNVPAQSPVILLVASDNALNAKGLTDFLRFAWPIIRRDVPGAELRIVGGVGARMEVDDPDVRTMGRIDDLASAYAEARVVINPAVAGTGLKIKTVEAIFHLRSIVCWPSGVEGIEPDLQAFCRVATNWHNFARHVIDLCFTEESEQTLLKQYHRIRERFSADVVYRALGESLLQLLGQSESLPPVFAQTHLQKGVDL